VRVLVNPTGSKRDKRANKLLLKRNAQVVKGRKINEKQLGNASLVLEEEVAGCCSHVVGRRVQRK
jgi:hypothetical protein